MDRRWNYALTRCEQCQVEKEVRIDQFNKNNKIWTCKICSRKGRTLKVKNPSPRHDPNKVGAWKSYWRAKKRVSDNHHGAYGHVEFRFDSFEQWFEELGPRPEGMSIDRINSRGHYEPGNVRWATHEQQCKNRASNHLVNYNGKMMCLSEAAKAAGVNRSTLERRLKSGCPESHLFLKKRWRYKNGTLAIVPA